jgi:hypothetical protein
MQLIARQELTSAAASITFSSIPQTYTDLYLVFSGRHSRTDFPLAEIQLRFNGLSTNQSARELRGLGGVGVQSNTYSYIPLSNIPSSSNTANTFSSTAIYIPNYTAEANKSVSLDNVSESNNTATFSFDLGIVAGLWQNTAAITSLGLQTGSGNLVSGSSATLYGILAGSDGIVTVS